MTPAATVKSEASPGDPVRAALDDPGVRADLANHACAEVGVRLRDKPATVRQLLVEDIVQETAARALQRRQEFVPTEGKASGWLHGILVNVLREHTRDCRRQPGPLPGDLDGWSGLQTRLPPPADEFADRHDTAFYLAGLSEDQRQVIDLRYRACLSSQQIADRLGISVGNARVRLSRAIRALKAGAGVFPEENEQ
jgi:RNA polymerase sigma factor (sigma-70 family)